MKVLLAGGCLNATASILCGQGYLQLEPLVLSGTPNPVVNFTQKQQELFCAAVVNAVPRTQTCRVLGFTGWRVCANTVCDVFRGDQFLDELFLDVVRNELSKDVWSHIEDETTRLLSSNDVCVDDANNSVDVLSSCSANVVGPDDPKQVHYDVAHDDSGCFKTMQSNNNCYNYGNDIVTNGFAQPGRRDFDQGSGLCKHSDRPCMKNTCDDVKRGAIADGLTWVGTTLPTELPKSGHYVSLHIWPNSNFHWLRMDANKLWSHKPGGSSVKNVDNNYNVITDPGNQDFSPWSQHCGYMHTLPSQIAAGPSAAQVEI